MVATSVCYIILIASFNGWHGGATAVSRYLIPLIPLLGLTLKSIPWQRWHIYGFIALGTVSALNMLALSTVSPLVEDGNPNPILSSYSRWFSGNIDPFVLTIRLHKFSPDFAGFKHFVTWNLGELMGIKGAWGIVPLLIMQIVLIALLFKLVFHQCRRQPENAGLVAS